MTTILPVKTNNCSTCQENARQYTSVLERLGGALEQLGQDVKALREETASLRAQVTVLTEERAKCSEIARKAEDALAQETGERARREEILQKIYTLETKILRLNLQDNTSQERIGWGWAVGTFAGLGFGGIGALLVGGIAGLVCTAPSSIFSHLKIEKQKKNLLTELNGAKQQITI